jgi:hypothetical protein
MPSTILPVILIEFRRFPIVGGERPDGSGLIWVLRNAASQRLKDDTAPEDKNVLVTRINTG